MRYPFVLALALVALPTGAFADRPTTEALLSRSAKQVEQGDFEQALITLQDALASPDNSNDDLTRLYWRMGEVYVFLARDRDAAESFERLLYLAPAFEPPRLAAPKVKRAFDATRTTFRAANRQIALDVPPPPAPPANLPFDLEASIEGLTPEHRARVYFRRALSDAWLAADLAPGEDGIYRARLPAFPPGASLEYYVEISGRDRRRLVGAGSSLSPKSLRVSGTSGASAVETPPVGTGPEVAASASSSTWIIAAIAGAVVVAGVATYIALQPGTSTLRARVVLTGSP